MIDLHTIATEQRNTATTVIDTLSTQDLVALINHADKEVPLAVEKILPALATAVDETASRIRQGGRLFYVGAGTSGRLGILDAAECPPTYNTDPQTVQALIAGGDSAVFTAKEGAEDSETAGARDLSSKEISPVDTVVGLSASGRTPYALGALRYAASCGAYTIGITSSPASPLAAVADLELCAVTGPEVITGSTRMKAGSAQKMILNILS
ncbi:MAG: N-acetylmuramic acid 6-phosphate etherase, partial [Megasphaera micronuciformis]|nr:N-acetylmuramic acid 6-phosphate etherase [Megasphaera micronuciformis]